MWNQLKDSVLISRDPEIKPPVVIDARLPKVRSFVVLLGVQRRVIQVSDQEIELLDERLLDGRRCFRQGLKHSLRERDCHQGFLDLLDCSRLNCLR